MKTPKLDATLYRRFQEGDASAFGVIYKHYFKSLCYFAYLITNSKNAENLAGDALIKLWKQRAAFSDGSRIKLFLYKTTHANCLTYLRYGKRSAAQEAYKEWQKEPMDELNIAIIETEVLRRLSEQNEEEES